MTLLTPSSRYQTHQRSLRLGLSAALLVSVAACSSVPPPKEQLAVSRSAVDRANSTAAADAPVEISAGRDKLARADIAMANKDYAQARQLAEQAEADAALAEARARSTRSDRALSELRDSIRALREELNRR